MGFVDSLLVTLKWATMSKKLGFLGISSRFKRTIEVIMSGEAVVLEF